ncbi:NADH:ubiquinone oxidoreductase subunit L [compost metagenome]
MTFPLIMLAVLSIFGGVLNLPEVLGGNAWLANFLSPVFADGARLQHQHAIAHSTEYMLMGVSIVGVLVMVFVAYNKYVKQGVVPQHDQVARTGLAKLSYHKFYVDEIYDQLIVKPINWLSVFFAQVVDASGIDGLVNAIGRSYFGTGK